jgi:uncharacterized membrane protein
MEKEAASSAADRLTFFSDAVMAIAMTLLALELPIPEDLTGDSGEQMTEMLAFFGDHTDEYLAFLISFGVIAIHWSTHFRVFRYLRAISSRLLQLNLVWLLLIVLTPFTTKIISLGENNLLRFSIYAGSQGLQFLIFAVIVWYLIKGDLMREGFDPARLYGSLSGVLPMAGAFLISIPVYAAVGSWAFFIWGIVPVVAGQIVRVRTARAGRTKAPDGR